MHVEIGVSNPQRPDRQERIKLLEDTGAMLSVLPRSLVEELGGDTSAGTVIFGEGDDPSVVGVTALKTLGFQVDPVTGDLKPFEMLLL